MSGPEDEYRARISNWFAGKVDVTYGSAGLHAEDVIQVGRWQLSLGMRIDWDDYLVPVRELGCGDSGARNC
ncbi:MAG: hypothetical protein OXL38_13660, partial [Gammaproteobacteria bacterium]|nr:hypothetical protein [Gammaproteobacteria bacterium]